MAATFTLSFAYEVYRATAKAGTSRHDSVAGLVAQLPLYAVAALVIGILFARHRHAAWIGVVFCTTVIVISIAYYNPIIMLERQPGMVDWIEDLVFTGLLFAAAMQLLNHIFRARHGASWVPATSTRDLGIGQTAIAARTSSSERVESPVPSSWSTPNKGSVSTGR